MMQDSMETVPVEKKFNKLLERVSGYAPPAALDRLKDAFEHSGRMFEDRRWVDGRPYILHALELADMLARMQQDIPSLLAALSHDCSGRAAAADGDPEHLSGEVSQLLRGFGNLRELESRSQSLEKVDSLRRMIIAEARDLRTLILHLADHSQIMQVLDHFPEEEKRRILDLSQKVYTPLTGRLGIHRLKSQLEDLGFRYAQPREYEEIIAALSRTRLEREKYIDEVSNRLRALLEERGIYGEVFGRVKHLYSIQQKMLRQNVTVEGIYDIIAFRAITDTEQRCWEILGILHGHWSPIAGRFRDYISAPKKNGYRSLHTSVIGPRRERMEVQIRTREMHRVAEEGVAAHWRYKDKSGRISPLEEKQLRWIASSLKEEPGETQEDVFSREIYVFTPAGAVIALPKEATPIDFAYAIHTSVGHRCSGAFVNGSMVPLSHKLKSGDLVKVVTRQGQHPSKDWLDMTVSSRAKTKIRSYLNTLQRSEQARRGKEILEKFLREKSLSLAKMEKKGRMNKVLEDMKANSLDDLYQKVASGKMEAEEIYGILQPAHERPREEGEDADRIFNGIERNSGEVRIGDISNLMVRFAGCCRPLPGDEIRGFITRGRGITIHRRNCPNFVAGDDVRKIDISWDIGQDMKTRAGLRILTEEGGGMLAKLTQFIASRGINVTAARAEKARDGRAMNLFTFEISSTAELMSLIRALEKINGVKSIERV
jgi:guanosine-3',5'-bis(diphosphate) 3'-pyrophosphohydrolase